MTDHARFLRKGRKGDSWRPIGLPEPAPMLTMSKPDWYRTLVIVFAAGMLFGGMFAALFQDEAAVRRERGRVERRE